MLKFIVVIIIFFIGIVIGAYLFSDTQPRMVFDIKNCSEDCFNRDELAGLLVSAGIQKTSSIVPKVIKETEKTIVVDHPTPETEIHYVVFPKKDIKNISEISKEDQDYVMDALATIREIVKEKELVDYQVITNGPGQQQITYLHFHLMAGSFKE